MLAPNNAPAAPGRTAPASLDAAGILGVLPHRAPMLLLDSVPWLERDFGVAVTRPLGLDRTGVPRPADGRVAPTFLIEAAAQLVAVAVIVGDRTGDPSAHHVPQPGTLAGVPEFEFPEPVAAGERLCVTATIERRLGRIVFARAELTAGARVVGRGRLTIAVGSA